MGERCVVGSLGWWKLHAIFTFGASVSRFFCQISVHQNGNFEEGKIFNYVYQIKATSQKHALSSVKL